MKATTIRTVIPPDHRLLLEVPEEVPAGPAEVVVRPIIETTLPVRGTGGDLLASGLFGIWKDRTDVADSVEFAKDLRQQAEQRRDG